MCFDICFDCVLLILTICEFFCPIAAVGAFSTDRHVRASFIVIFKTLGRILYFFVHCHIVPFLFSFFFYSLFVISLSWKLDNCLFNLASSFD